MNMNPTESKALSHVVASSASGQYLSFRLGNEHYGTDIMKVQEIRSYEEPTRMVNAPAYIRGVVNLRGVIVPIVDLRLRLNMAAEFTPATVVIVLDLGHQVVGAVVDAVSDVVTLAPEQIQPAPATEGGTVSADCIQGLAQVDERLVILLNLGALLAQTAGVQA